MCILCVVQRWSRWVATMLPYLVIPLVVLWALSQLFPPGYRFEITSSRLGCVIVLLLTLFWYEILNPQLQVWRSRRSAWLRERHHAQALELQKLKKTATRRCRNCLTPYRDQNPGGGRFMCSYCGHISKRPVLDLPMPVKSKGIIDDLVGKNGWMCSQAWSAEGNGNWGESVPRNWIGNKQCSAEKSYSGVLIFACKLLSSFFLSLRCLCGKVFRFGSRGDGLSDADRRGLSTKRGENGDSSQESRSEKARRKAEERRQARLEKEMLEEEERKQREEVARLVEERRRLRDEKLEVERVHSKGSAPDGEKESRRDLEKKRHDKRKDKDRGSTKSNSDGEDPEKRASRERERKREFDKKSVNERRESPRSSVEVHRSQMSEHGTKVTPSKPRYFGRMTGTFLSPSQGFGSTSFFRRNSQNSTAPVTKANKPTVGLVDHGSGIKREAQISATSNGDGRTSGTNLQPVGSEFYSPPAAPKKSWHQLFTRSAVSVSPYLNSNTSTYQSQNTDSGNTINQREQPNYPSSQPNYHSDNQFNFERPLPFTGYHPSNGVLSSNSFPHLSAASVLPPVKDLGPNSILEEPELFEDPCYDPDPVSLLGPVSESLDNFPLDLGIGFISDDKVEVPCLPKHVSVSGEINKPSPIESPMSRSRASEEKTSKLGVLSCTSNSLESHTLELDKKTNTQGTWQMWGTPLATDGLGLVCEPSSWLLPIGQNKKEDITHSLSHRSPTLQIAKENHGLPGTQPPQHVHLRNHQNGGTYSPHGHNAEANALWLSKEPFQSSPVDGESHFLPLSLIDNIQHADIKHNNSSNPAAGNSFEMSPTTCWNKKDWVLNGTRDADESNPATPLTGGLFSTSPDVQSVWSFSQKETINTTEPVLIKDNHFSLF